MRRFCRYIIVVVIMLYFHMAGAVAQDPVLNINFEKNQYILLDSNWLLNTYTGSIFSNPLSTAPDKNDRLNLVRYAHLQQVLPTVKNHDQYYKMACSLWELQRLKPAEVMFTNILHSSIRSYDTRYHSSGTLYGYGSFTSSDKNAAAIYLAKIRIKQKRYKEALHYLQVAEKKYPVYFTCGTGAMWQEGNYKMLYGLCYQGLGWHDMVVALFLPESGEYTNELLVDAVEKLYSTETIATELQGAMAKIQYEEYEYPSFTTQERKPGVKDDSSVWNAVTDTTYYHCGKTTTYLFGTKISLGYPRLELSSVVERKDLETLLIKSDLYQALQKIVSKESNTISAAGR